jgi:hypothetical protein
MFQKKMFFSDGDAPFHTMSEISDSNIVVTMFIKHFFSDIDALFHTMSEMASKAKISGRSQRCLIGMEYTTISLYANW